MTEFKSLAARKDHYERSWAELSDDERQLIQQKHPLWVPAYDPELAAAIAIVRNAAMATQGRWQYSTDAGAQKYDDETAIWIDIPTSGLSDTNAIVLPTTAALRFKPLKNWYGTPGSLKARVSDDKGALPATGPQDISAGIGGAGRWLAGTITIGMANDPRPWALRSHLDTSTFGSVVTKNELAAVGNSWDGLSVDLRRQLDLEWDAKHDPAREKEQQDGFDSAVREADLERQIREWELIAAPTALDLAKKEARLAELRQELAREKLRFTRNDPTLPTVDLKTVVADTPQLVIMTQTAAVADVDAALGSMPPPALAPQPAPVPRSSALDNSTVPRAAQEDPATDRQIADWLVARRRELQAAGEKHGRDRLLGEAMKRFRVQWQVVKSVWTTMRLGKSAQAKS